MKEEIIKLTSVLGIGGINGAIPLAALAGLFRPENALMLALTFMAGPGAILTSALMEGVAKQRMIAAFLAGIISTIIVVLSAGIGPAILGFFNINIIKIFGAISIGLIALMVAGINIHSKLPLLMIIIGIVIGGIAR